MNLTDEQHAICQAGRDLDVGSSLKIQAFAGTGKTTTLAAIADSLAQRKFLCLVFNRAAAVEAEHKMPSNVMVRTAHALAFRSVGYVYKSRLTGNPWAWFPYLKEKMPRALDSVVRMGRDTTSAGALIIRILEQFLRTTDGAIGAIHAPYGCDDNVAATAGYAAEALWKNICKHNSTAPVTHDCYLKLFYLQARGLAPRDWTVMLDEAQDADPVILGLLERHQGARIVVGDKYQQLYQWRGAVNALSQMRSDNEELSLTRTFRFGAGAAEWANRVLEIIGEKLRITPAPHRTTVSIEDKSVTVDALLARTNAGRAMALSSAGSTLRRISSLPARMGPLPPRSLLSASPGGALLRPVAGLLQRQAFNGCGRSTVLRRERAELETVKASCSESPRHRLRRSTAQF